MVQEIKYTDDNKKVIVVGKLNAQDTIVQEIFISNGNEIPSGENFVVRSLHNSPVESWKDKDLREREERYAKRKDEISSHLELLEKQYRTSCNKLGAFISYNVKLEKVISNDSFATFVNFVTGKIKYIVIGNYDFEIVEYDKFNIQYERDLKLITLFGCTDGGLQYRIDTYSDGSGGSNQKLYPFTDYDLALQKLKELIYESTLNEVTIRAARKYKIELPKDKVSDYKKRQSEMHRKNIDYHEGNAAQSKKLLDALDNIN